MGSSQVIVFHLPTQPNQSSVMKTVESAKADRLAEKELIDTLKLLKESNKAISTKQVLKGLIAKITLDEMPKVDQEWQKEVMNLLEMFGAKRDTEAQFRKEYQLYKPMAQWCIEHEFTPENLKQLRKMIFIRAYALKQFNLADAKEIAVELGILD
jgi:hypothetical protein